MPGERPARGVDLGRERVDERHEPRDHDRQRDVRRIAPARHLAAVARDQARERVGGGGLVEAHGLTGLTERREVAVELGRLAHRGQFFEPSAPG